ncbi:MAG: thioredoxin [Ruminococcus sp.]|nr:thioredoxin [Ruminococcus sp.]
MAKEITMYDFETEVLNNSKPVIVDFYADWCGPCKMMAPVFKELSSEITDCDFYKINIDNEQDLASKYQVMSIPTVIIFKDGEPVLTSVGFLSKDDLAEKIESVVNG